MLYFYHYKIFAIYLEIHFLCLSLSVDLNDDHQSCQNFVLPSGYKIWKDIENEQIIVKWQLPACVDSSSCLGVQAPFNFNSIFQQRPVHIQEETSLVFMSDQKGIEYFKVLSAEDFLTCNISKAMNISETIVSVAKQSLSLGNNYFLAKGNDFFDLCKFGFKLNVTVQSFNCNNKKNVCSAAGICAAMPWQSQFTCQCCTARVGNYCEEIDGCYNIKCQNNGQCLDIPDIQSPLNIFTCKCPIGFEGQLCEHQVAQYCEVNKCMHLGTCFKNSTNILDYSCICTAQYSGKVCENEIDFCASNPCLHSGLCVPNPVVPYYQCQCLKGFEGFNCEVDKRPCTEDLCKNGGICNTVDSSPKCQCLLGFTGADCSAQISTCDPNPCVNAIECIAHATDFTCTCLPGFSGLKCNVNNNECQSNPCLGQQKCIDGIASYICKDIFSNVSQMTSTPIENYDILTTLTVSSQLSGVAIAFIIIGVLLAVILLLSLLIWCCIRKGYCVKICEKRGEIKYIRQSDDFVPNSIPTVFPGELFSDETHPITTNNNNKFVNRRIANRF